MDHAHRMGSVQNAHNRREHSYSVGWRKLSALLQFRIERVALDVLHDEIDRAVG